MRIAQIREQDIVNGEGIGVSLFVQGCTHHCYKCFNQEAWDFNLGVQFTDKLKERFIKLCANPYVDFISFLGGEPLDQPLGIYETIQELIKNNINKPIYLWTGYKWEDILKSKSKMDVIGCIDYLIDGEYIERLKNLNLKLRGSSNQRIIDVKKSLKTNQIIERKDLY